MRVSLCIKVYRSLFKAYQINLNPVMYTCNVDFTHISRTYDGRRCRQMVVRQCQKSSARTIVHPGNKATGWRCESSACVREEGDSARWDRTEREGGTNVHTHNLIEYCIPRLSLSLHNILVSAAPHSTAPRRQTASRLAKRGRSLFASGDRAPLRQSRTQSDVCHSCQRENSNF